MTPDAYCRFPLRLAFLLVLLAGSLCLISPRADAVQLTAYQCQELAVWAADTVWAKHVGGDKEKVRAWYRAEKSPIFRILLMDIDKIWELDISYRDALYQVVIESCNNRRGVYPDEA